MRYLRKYGYLTSDYDGKLFVPSKACLEHVSYAPFHNCFEALQPPDLRTVLDRLETLPSIELGDFDFIFDHLPLKSCDETRSRAAGWVANPHILTRLRIYGLELVSEYSLEQALATCRVLIRDEQHDQEFAGSLISWLSTHRSDADTGPLLEEAYGLQKARGHLSLVMIDTISSTPGVRALRICEELLRSHVAPDIQKRVVAGLGDVRWSMEPSYADDRMHLLLLATQSPHEIVRLRSIVVLANLVVREEIIDGDSVRDRLSQLAESDASDAVKIAALHDLRRLSDSKRR